MRLPDNLSETLEYVYVNNNPLMSLPVKLYRNFFNIIITQKKLRLFQIDAVYRINKWYKYRKLLKSIRGVVISNILINNITDSNSNKMPKDISFLITSLIL